MYVDKTHYLFFDQIIVSFNLNKNFYSYTKNTNILTDLILCESFSTEYERKTSIPLLRSRDNIKICSKKSYITWPSCNDLCLLTFLPMSRVSVASLLHQFVLPRQTIMKYHVSYTDPHVKLISMDACGIPYTTQKCYLKLDDLLVTSHQYPVSFYHMDSFAAGEG